MIKLMVVVVVALWIGLSMTIYVGINYISDMNKMEKQCKDYAIMYNKDVNWMDGYKICFDLKTGKAINLKDVIDE